MSVVGRNDWYFNNLSENHHHSYDQNISNYKQQQSSLELCVLLPGQFTAQSNYIYIAICA